jgi:hypothetical protein
MSPNSWWFLGLMILSLILQIFIYFKKRELRSLLIFLVMVEFAFLIETVIYIFGESYVYFPKIIKNNPYYDSNAGALASNLMIVPTLALQISVFNLNWIWIFFFTAFLTGVEWLFLRIHIYVHNWYRTWYTSFGLLFVYFPLGKVFYRRLSKPLHGWEHSIFLFLCTAPILGCMHIIPIMWLNNRAYLPEWFQDPAHDTTAVAAVYHILVAIILVIITKVSWKHWWLKYVLIAGISFATTYILMWMNILQSYIWWDPWYYIGYHVIALKISEAMGRRLLKGQ